MVLALVVMVELIFERGGMPARDKQAKNEMGTELQSAGDL